MSPFMESEKLLISRGNPRTSSYSSDRLLPTTSGRPMTNEWSQKTSPSIAQRFRALIKQRDDEFMVSDDDILPPPNGDDVVQLYELMLSELTFNSKPIITDLTVLADEQRAHGKGIADLICARILEVPVDQKLPSLYLLDSIVKNIGNEYVSYFSPRLPEVFCEAYRQVHPNLHHAMRHLFGTWSTVFPPSTLRKIETQLQLSQLPTRESSDLTPLRASESPRPTHGIHVNPKYLRPLDHSVVDKHIQDARGNSTLKVHDQKPTPGYEEFDYEYDHAEVVEHGGAQAYSSMGSMGHDSFALGTNKANIKLAKPSLSSRIGPNRSLQSVADEVEAHRASPSQHGYDYDSSRMIDRSEDTNQWRRKQYTGDNLNGLESTSYNHRNGHALDGPRALIEAYGSDKGKGYLNDNAPQVEHFSINGIDNKVTPVTWQNTEEEEFDWENMSPTVVDRGRSNVMSKPPVPPSRFRTRLGFDRSSATSIEAGMRSSWSNQAQLTASVDSPMVAEDAVPLAPDSWHMLNHLSHTSQNLMNAKGIGRNIQMPSSGRGTTSSGGEKMSSFVDKLPATDALHRPPTIDSRFGSSSLDSSIQPQSVIQSMDPRHPLIVHNSCPPSGPSIFPAPKHNKSQFESVNGSNSFTNRPNRSSFMPEQQMNNFIKKEPGLTTKLPQVSNHHAGRISLTRGSQLQAIPIKSELPPLQDMRDNFTPTVPPMLPHLMAPSLSQGYGSQGHRPAISKNFLSPAPIGQWNLPIHNNPNNSLHMRGGTLPPPPPGPHPNSVQTIPHSQNAGSHIPGQQPGPAFSGLISSLMAQGLISLNNQASVQDSIGLEFNPDVLKVRHESAITALYADLPRQCMTCGLRFKSQDEHSTHMDWHVTKNRMSKSRKQKPSRKWFVSSSMWLSGAEALGTEAVPGFLPAEIIVEKKDDEELAVPADEDQNACALCGEPFDDFYSDETEEWMYKGAVYMNAPDGQTAGMDKYQLGPIVHAKCRSESNVAPPENSDQDDQGGVSEEGSQRKRQRS